MDSLNNKEINDKAIDVLRIFKMWDIDRLSSIRIAQQMISVASATSDQNWTNPLAGTGLTVPGSKNFKEENAVSPAPGLPRKLDG